jgi:hypothetical protein
MAFFDDKVDQDLAHLQGGEYMRDKFLIYKDKSTHI